MKICVFGASGDNLDSVYFEAAFNTGREIARAGHTLIFGGGNGGLMGACARGVSSLNGDIIGIAPRFFDEPGVLYRECTDFIYTDTMAQRKKLMEDRCDAFIVLPGGIGTFEEFFEALTLKQLGQMCKPIAVLNTAEYYNSLLRALDTAVEGGFLSRACLSLFTVCGKPGEAVRHCSAREEDLGSIRRLEDYTK